MEERHALDPVCGMTVDIDSAAARTTWKGLRYHFCAESCRDLFVGNPLRYLGEGMEAPAEFDDSAGSDGSTHIRACPACETPVPSIDPAPPILGRLTMAEFATLVRQEWRRRLGRRAYTRHHSSRLIRALALHALRPESPVASISLEEELGLEVARLRADGLNRPQVQRELYHLARAAGKVLMRAGLTARQTAGMTETLDRTLLTLLDWQKDGDAEKFSMAESA
jgi:YHS domain-containing protein